MAPPTLLTLPVEIRQQIFSHTITILYKGAKVGGGTSPLLLVCKTTQADIAELSSSWLPDPNTGSIAPITHPENFGSIVILNNLFFDRAISSNRTWPGIQELHLKPILNNYQKYFFDLTDTFQFRKYSSHILARHLIADGFRTFLYYADRIPDTVQRIKYDLTIPDVTFRLLEEFGPVTPGRKRNKYQLQFWEAFFGATVFSLANACRQWTGPDVAFEIIGTIPESQVDILACANYANERPQMHPMSCLWKLSTSLGSKRCSIDLFEYTKPVRARRAEFALEEEGRLERLKEHRQKHAKRMVEAKRRRKEEIARRKKEQTERRAETKKRKMKQ